MNINWIKQDPNKWGKRLIYECEQLNIFFPLFKLKTIDDILYAEGPLITNSKNVYLVKIYYPSNYPYSPPEPVITDKDVVDFCCNKGSHDFHNYGRYKDGVKLCIIKPDDTIGEGWKTNYSVVTIINLVCLWLHAYEYKKAFGGKWILPEA